MLAIPNPVTQSCLCKSLADRRADIDAHLRQCTLSRSTPTVRSDHRRAVSPAYDRADLPPMRMQIRSSSKWILKADISSFYPSVYTHCVPWAIHGKRYSKAHRRKPVLGNRLDELVRCGQDSQTKGIPIGPDSSLVIAEIVLSAADRDLLERLPQLRGFRHWDDFEFGFTYQAEAEEALATLQDVLKDYELELGTQKTDICQLPDRIEARWVPQLRDFEFRRRRQGTDLTTYFDLAYELAKSHPDDHVLKYAVSRLRRTDGASLQIEKASWPLLQHFLLQCLMVETGTVAEVLEVLIRYHEAGYDVDRTSIEKALNSQLVHQCSFGYGNEAAWSIWALIYWGIPIDTEAAAALSGSRDPVVILLSLDARQRDLASDALYVAEWQKLMDGDYLRRPEWLVSYEANVKDWLPSAGVSDHVLNDPDFRFLKRLGVQFHDPAKTPTSVPAGEAIDADQLAPLFQDWSY